MRALIWADLHGHNYREFSTIEDGTNTRLRDCADVIEKISHNAVKNDVDLIWFCGDLFQLKNNLDNQVIQLIMYKMKDLAEKFPLLLVPGHHDLYMWSTNPIMMEILAVFSGRIQLCSESGWINPESAKIQIYVEPCTRKIKGLDERIERVEPRKDAIFLAHQDVIGVRYGGFVVEHGLNAGILSKKFRWSFVGHWHAPGKILSYDNIISVGAPLQHNFGDANQPRGWWILDTEKAIVKFVANIESPVFFDIKASDETKEIPGDPAKDFYRIALKGESTKLFDGIKWKRISRVIETQTKKRTTISFSDKKEDILEKYVKMRGGNLDHKKLVEVGRRYL